MPNPSTIAEQDCADPQLITDLETEIAALKAHLNTRNGELAERDEEIASLLRIIRQQKDQIEALSRSSR
jgi:hypothetical protein